ncbi:uncharacterized protein PV06_08639 [Exophiala oligosperma]|uniref:Uncharacterized protein n=1 Tax=Exophiala oligosperma TaxID=215243 RepID=A0A0D2D8K9_9EURO|nr:uncharacterized protein PV06_08639 [Exophiala oligosperma]KIW38800.1 hypothetical protein PV06_08639 [Exophiala oligosperma]
MLQCSHQYRVLPEFCPFFVNCLSHANQHSSYTSFADISGNLILSRSSHRSYSSTRSNVRVCQVGKKAVASSYSYSMRNAPFEVTLASPSPTVTPTGQAVHVCGTPGAIDTNVLGGITYLSPLNSTRATPSNTTILSQMNLLSADASSAAGAM